jgi:hypothetical protein
MSRLYTAGYDTSDWDTDAVTTTFNDVPEDLEIAVLIHSRQRCSLIPKREMTGKVLLPRQEMGKAFLFQQLLREVFPVSL